MRSLLLCVLSLGLVACRDARLFSGLEERAANEVLSKLDRYEVRATKRAEPGEPPGWALFVDSEDFGRALEICRAEGLPREPRRGTAALRGDAMLTLPSELKERAEMAKAQAE